MNSLLLALALASSQEIPESLLATELNGRDVFPAAFHGLWASNLEDCRTGMGAVQITSDRFIGYESRAVLIISGGIIHHSTPSGETAVTTINLIGQSDESGDVGIGKLRISRVGARLYTSNADAVSEDEHWRYSNIRCPG